MNPPSRSAARGPAPAARGARGGARRNEAKRDSEARRKAERRKPQRSVRQRRTRVALALGVSVVLVGFLFTFYFPTRTWFAQRRSAASATHQLDELSNTNRTLEAQARALKDPSVIAEIARNQYGMVKPGEKAFVVLPPPSAPTALPKIWPFEQSVTPAAPNSAQGQVSAGGSSPPTTG